MPTIFDMLIIAPVAPNWSAARLELPPFKRKVVGSSPTRCTIGGKEKNALFDFLSNVVIRRVTSKAILSQLNDW